jgi:CubicO group peptidase (beta-lactamase class C family)
MHSIARLPALNVLAGTLLLLFCLSAHAQQNPGKELTSYIDSLANDALKRGPVASICIGVKKDGKILLEKAYGFANVQLSAPATIHSVYMIGSVSKMFTAIAVMQLIEQGKLSLDDEIGKWLEGYDSVKKHITVRQLLSHTSGLHNYGGDFWEKNYKSFYMTPLQWVDEARSHSLDFSPGTSYSYSNTGFDVLALVVEKVSREKFSDYIAKRIAQPAGLRQTYHSPVQTIIPNQVSWYDARHDTLYRADEWGNNGYGAGMIQTSIDDLLRFQDAINANILLHPVSLRQMRTSLNIDGQTYPYGFGTRIRFYPSHTGYGHTGSGGGITALLRYFPDSDLTVAVLMNTENDHDPAFPTSAGIGGLIEKKILNIQTSIVKDLPIPKNDLDIYTGEWAPNSTIYNIGDQLWVRVKERSDSSRLMYQGNHRFIIDADRLSVLDFQIENGIAGSIVVYRDYDFVSTIRRKK